MAASVCVRQLSFSPPGSGVEVLHRCDLTLRPGLSVLRGPSGCGKTTLLSVVAGLAEPTSGSCAVGEPAGGGAAHTPPGVRSQRVALVLQFPERHFLTATVGEELRFGQTEAGAVLRAALLLRVCGLGALQGAARLRALSGGTQRRFAVALALSRGTGVVLLDEPLAGLDLAAQRAVAALLHRAARQRTILVATHDEAALRQPDGGAQPARWTMMPGGRLAAGTI